MADPQQALIVMLMGVSGCGKSTVAGELQARLGWPFCEGDDLHPTANVEKMANGRPLTDDDRWPWLRAIRSWIDERIAAGESALVTCSALKRSYRDVLRADDVVFVLLDGTRDQLVARLAARRGHFMPIRLLDSQLSTLERPGHDERAIRIRIGPSAAVQAETIRKTLAV